MEDRKRSYDNMNMPVARHPFAASAAAPVRQVAKIRTAQYAQDRICSWRWSNVFLHLTRVFEATVGRDGGSPNGVMAGLSGTYYVLTSM